jgi:hypothetical protein
MRLTESQVRGIVAGILRESNTSDDETNGYFYREAMSLGSSAARNLEADLRLRYDPTGALGMRLISTTMQVIRYIDDLNKEQEAAEAGLTEKSAKLEVTLDDVFDAIDNNWGSSTDMRWMKDPVVLRRLAALRGSIVGSIDLGHVYHRTLAPDAYRFIHGLYEVTKSILAQGYDPSGIVTDEDADALSEEIMWSMEHYKLSHGELRTAVRTAAGTSTTEPGAVLSTLFPHHDERVWNDLSDASGMSLEDIGSLVFNTSKKLFALPLFGAATTRYNLTAFTNFAESPFLTLRLTPLRLLENLDAAAWEMSQP